MIEDLRLDLAVVARPIFDVLPGHDDVAVGQLRDLRGLLVFLSLGVDLNLGADLVAVGVEDLQLDVGIVGIVEGDSTAPARSPRSHHSPTRRRWDVVDEGDALGVDENLAADLVAVVVELLRHDRTVARVVATQEAVVLPDRNEAAAVAPSAATDDTPWSFVVVVLTRNSPPTL